MAFHSGSQGALSSPTHLSTFLDTLATMMTDHGFSLVETYPSSGTNICKVFKSAQADNGKHDFYIGVGYNTNYDSIFFCLAEEYDSDTHKFNDFVPYDGNAIPDSAHNYTFPHAGELWTETTKFKPDVSISTSSFSWWFSVNSKRVLLSARVGTYEYGLYAGLLENVLNETDHPSSAVALGLICGEYSGGGGSSYGPVGVYRQQGMTREPGATTADHVNFATYNDTYIWPHVLNLGGTWPYKSGNVAGRCPLYPNTATRRWPRALLLDCLMTPGITGQACGDTLTVGDDTYVAMALRLSPAALKKIWVNQAS